MEANNRKDRDRHRRTTMVNFRCPEALRRKLARIAEADDLTITQVGRAALRAYVLQWRKARQGNAKEAA